MMDKKRITIIGAGYVGLGTAAIFSKKHQITILDIDKEKIEMINSSNIKNQAINEYISYENIQATEDFESACKESNYIFICLPTDFNNEKKGLDVSIIEKEIKKIVNLNTDAVLVIKSTVPIGFTESISIQYPELDIIFTPEFLREGFELEDSLKPSRLIIGSKNKKVSKNLIELIKESSAENSFPIYETNLSESEAIKLFSNAYLATRVAFFNELDSFAMSKDLNSRDIIQGLSFDTRIGNYYNNPSFGFGGYCLPKDIKELERHLPESTNIIVSAASLSNSQRKEFITKDIIRKSNGVIGIYRLLSKDNNDNFRNSAVIDIINLLLKERHEIIIFEPEIVENSFLGVPVISDFKEFKEKSSLIVCNRSRGDFEGYERKLYSRDIFKRDT
tara:strand:+ start:2098 stop:3270 length:1173 start_codon:yes stop_codon:yes gene_type:complete